MVFEANTNKIAKTEFKEILRTGVFISLTDANKENSMRRLKQNGLRPLTYQEALVKIDQSPKLKEQLKGKTFYLKESSSLKENSPDLSRVPSEITYILPNLYYNEALCYFNTKGELIGSQIYHIMYDENTNNEKCVYVRGGLHPPLWLSVTTDNFTYGFGRRFELISDGLEFTLTGGLHFTPDFVAPAVVGVELDPKPTLRKLLHLCR